MAVHIVSESELEELSTLGDSRPHAYPEQFASAARFVEREWGYDGYCMSHVAGGFFHVVHSDGSRFLVYADRWGNCSDVDIQQ